MTATWTATPRQVEDVLGPVLPHAGGDRHLPMICCLNVEVVDGRLVAAATNRYTLGVAWAELVDWDENAATGQTMSARVYADDLRRMLSFLRPYRSDAASWTLTDTGLSVVTGGGEQLTIRTVDVEFPRWRKIIGERAAQESAAMPAYGIDPRWVALFGQSAKAIGGHEPMSWSFGSTAVSATLITIGERFLGLLMPVRLPDDRPQIDLSTLGIDVPKAVAA